MSRLKLIEESLDAEIQEAEGKLKALKQVKLSLNVTELKGGIPLTSNANLVQGSNAPVGYKPKGQHRQKLRYIMTELNKPCSSKDFESKIIEYEGEKSRLLRVLDRQLRGLAHPNIGELLWFQYFGSKIRFYIKSEWLGEDKRSLVGVEYPNPGEVNDISPEQVMPENIRWQKSK